MKDTSGAQVLGRTSLKRLGIVMVPTILAAGVLTVMMADGAVAVGFDISGQTAQMTVGQLSGSGFAQFGNVDQSNAGGVAVAVSEFKNATITGGLCQAVTTDLPVLGNYTMVLKASGAKATSLVIDMQALNAANAQFTNINIGQDAGSITKSVAPGAPGQFGQYADNAVLTNIDQTSNATSAGQFALQNMSVSMVKGAYVCPPQTG